MAFQDDFAQCMSNAGINVTADAVPDASAIQGVIDYMKQWFDGLEDAVKQAFDETSKDETVSFVLSSSDANIVHDAYTGLLHAFDAAQGFSLSLCLQWCEHCAQQAAAGQPAT